MALILLGRTTCSICGEVLKTEDEILGFPPFVSNPADPLLLFHDHGCHKKCVLAHPLWPKLSQRMAEWGGKTGPGNRACFICGTQITRENDYFGLGHLTDNSNHPLYEFNYAHFHRSHLLGWAELPTLIREIDNFDQLGVWKGDSLKQVVKELREYTT